MYEDSSDEEFEIIFHTQLEIKELTALIVEIFVLAKIKQFRILFLIHSFKHKSPVPLKLFG